MGPNQNVRKTSQKKGKVCEITTIAKLISNCVEQRGILAAGRSFYNFIFFGNGLVSCVFRE